MKKNIKIILLLVGTILAMLSFGLTACSKQVKVTFNSDGGSIVQEVVVKEGSTISKPSDPTKAGYDFSGWQLDGVDFDFSDAIVGNITLKAVWTPRSDIVYTVKHLQENLNNDDFTLKESESKTGKTGTKTAATVKPYQGFTAGEITQITIAGDGSTVVEIRYSRNKYKITFKTEDGKVIEEKSYKYNAEVTVPEHTVEAGYDFSWDKEIVKATEEAVYTEVKTPADMPYKVEIYLQNVDGTYADVAGKTTELVAQMGSEVKADIPSVTGFTFDEGNDKNILNGVISADGLALKLYYTRNTVSYTYLDAHGSEMFLLSNVKYSDPNAVGCPYTPFKVDSLQHAYTFEGWHETEKSSSMIICSPKYSYEGKMVDFSNAITSRTSDFVASYDAVNDIYNFGLAVPSDIEGEVIWRNTGVKIEDLDYSRFDTIAIKYRSEININYLANISGKIFLAWDGVEGVVLQAEIIKSPKFKYLVITGNDYNTFLANIEAIKEADLMIGFFQTAGIQIAEMCVVNFATSNIAADFVDMANADIYSSNDAYRLSTWDYESGVYELYNKKNFSYLGACWAPMGNHPINPLAAFEKATKLYVNIKGPIGTNVYIGTREDGAQGSTSLKITLTSDDWTEYVIEGDQLSSFLNDCLPCVMADNGGIQFAHDREGASVFFGAMYFTGEKKVDSKKCDFINFTNASVYTESDPYRLSSVINDGRGYRLESKNCFGSQGACWAPLGIHPSVSISSFKYASKMVLRVKGATGATLLIGTREDNEEGATALKITLTSNEYHNYVVYGEQLKMFVEKHLPYMMKDVGGLQIGYTAVGVVEIEEIYFEFEPGGADGSYVIDEPKIPVIDTALINLRSLATYAGDPYRIGNYDTANDAYYFKAIAFVHDIDGQSGIWAPTNKDIVPKDTSKNYNAIKIKLKGTVGSTFYFGSRRCESDNLKIVVESEEYQEYIFTGEEFENFLTAYYAAEKGNDYFEIGTTSLNAEIMIREITLINISES